MERVLYTAEATVTGGRAHGHGRTSDGVLDVQIRSPKEPIARINHAITARAGQRVLSPVIGWDDLHQKSGRTVATVHDEVHRARILHSEFPDHTALILPKAGSLNILCSDPNGT